VNGLEPFFYMAGALPNTEITAMNHYVEYQFSDILKTVSWVSGRNLACRKSVHLISISYALGGILMYLSRTGITLEK